MEAKVDKETFWTYVTGFNPGGKKDESGWDGITHQIRAVVRRRFPNVDEFDWEYIELRAIEMSMRNFDPAKGAINTWICWWAQHAAYRWLKRSCRQPGEICFSDIEDPEEELDVLEYLFPVHDVYNELSPVKADILKNVMRTDLSILSGHNSIIGYTVSDLIEDLSDGLTDVEISVKSHLSLKSIPRMRERLRKKLEDLKIRDEIVARVSARDQCFGRPPIQDAEGAEQGTEGV